MLAEITTRFAETKSCVSVGLDCRRKMATLEPTTTQHVSPESVIMSYSWRAYIDIPNLCNNNGMPLSYTLLTRGLKPDRGEVLG